MLDTGLHASAVCASNVGVVDLERLTVSVRLGKGRRDRTRTTSAKTAHQVSRYLLRTRACALHTIGYLITSSITLATVGGWRSMLA